MPGQWRPGKIEFDRWLVSASAPGHGPGCRDQPTFATSKSIECSADTVSAALSVAAEEGALHLKLGTVFARALIFSPARAEAYED